MSALDCSHGHNLLCDSGQALHRSEPPFSYLHNEGLGSKDHSALHFLGLQKLISTFANPCKKTDKAL